jgi:primary-amine oxidase
VHWQQLGGQPTQAAPSVLASTHRGSRWAPPPRIQGRIWKIKNPAVTCPTSKAPVAYKLMPHAAPLLLAQPDSLITRKGHFATKNLWVSLGPRQRLTCLGPSLRQLALHSTGP